MDTVGEEVTGFIFTATPAAAASSVPVHDATATAVVHSDEEVTTSDTRPIEAPLAQKFSDLSVSSSPGLRHQKSSPSPPSPESTERKRSGNSTPATPAAAFRLSRISTPMQGNSPSTSQVSVNSVPPNMVACLMADLTPVTRNTSSAVTQQYVCNQSNLISPEETLLLGEDLVMPSNEDWYPKIRPSGAGLASARAMKTRSQDEGSPFDPPAPLERKFYSFTSRQQYEEAMIDDDPQLPPPPRLTPYQPNRELLGDFGLQEDLNEIFIERRRYVPNEAPSDVEVVDASKLHRMLHLPIPMDERQTSIPSIRLANHLNGSVTSREDDEDSLYIHDEEASISSRGSTCAVYFDEAPVDTTATRLMIERRKRGRKEDALEWLQSVVEVSENTLAEAASSKFLTRQEYCIPPHSSSSSAPSSVPFQRQDSSPPGYFASFRS
jgi:hypothetical protein